MPIFGSASPFDPDVAKVTAEMNTKEDWALIMEICDRVQHSTTGPKDCIKAINKRLNHNVPHVVMQSLTLLDACVKNCGRPFHLEVSSRDFTQEIVKLIKKGHPKVQERMKELLQKWAEDEFASDQALHLIPSLYSHLKGDGISFPASAGGSTKAKEQKPTRETTRTNVVSSSNKEEDDLAKAIELSLQESKQKSGGGGVGSAPSGGGASSSLYPVMSTGVSSTPMYSMAPSSGGGGAGYGSSPQKEPRRVRALYDFEAAEDNELTFKAGEVVFVTDDSDANWWKGHNQRGEGLFPANFVTSDLEYQPEPILKTERKVQFSETVECKVIEKEPEVVEIDEEKMDRVLNLLDDADPTGERPDAEEMLNLEEQVKGMGPLIDVELEKVDKRSNSLAELNKKLMDAITLYHTLMKEPAPSTTYSQAMMMKQQQQQQPPPLPQPPYLGPGQAWAQPATTYHQPQPMPPEMYAGYMPAYSPMPPPPPTENGGLYAPGVVTSPPLAAPPAPPATQAAPPAPVYGTTPPQTVALGLGGAQQMLYAPPQPPPPAAPYLQHPQQQQQYQGQGVTYVDPSQADPRQYMTQYQAPADPTQPATSVHSMQPPPPQPPAPHPMIQQPKQELQQQQPLL